MAKSKKPNNATASTLRERFKHCKYSTDFTDLAEQLLAKGDRSQAEHAIEQASQVAKGFDDKEALLASLHHLKLGSPALRESLLSYFERRRDPIERLVAVQILFSAGETARGRALLERRTKRCQDPYDLASYAEAAGRPNAGNDPALAGALIDRAITAATEQDQLQWIAASCVKLQDLARLQKVIKILESKAHWLDQDTRFDLAQMFTTLDPDETKRRLRALTNYALDPLTLLMVMEEFIKVNANDDAMALVPALLRDGDTDDLLLGAKLTAALGGVKAQQSLLERARSIAERSDQLVELSHFYAKGEKPEMALKLIEQAWSQSEDISDRLYLIEVFAEPGFGVGRDTIRERLQQVHESAAKSTELLEVGETFQQLGFIDEAAAAYQEAATASAGTEELLYAGWAFIKLGRLEDAEALYTQATRQAWRQEEKLLLNDYKLELDQKREARTSDNA